MIKTHALLAVALATTLAACGGDSMGDDAPGPITGMISADTTWSGALELTGFVSIEPGVVVTVAPGTTIDVATGSSIDVAGTLEVQGEKGNVVRLATPAGEHWLGVSVSGTYTMHYGSQIGGGIFTTSPTALATIIDSELSHAIGDYVILNDGSVDIEHTNLGNATEDSTHCNMHINASRTVTFTHNNNAGSHYGLMFYAGTGDFTHNNWFANQNVDVQADGGAAGHFDDSYFEHGIPVGMDASTFTNRSEAKLADCGPR